MHNMPLKSIVVLLPVLVVVGGNWFLRWAMSSTKFVVDDIYAGQLIIFSASLFFYGMSLALARNHRFSWKYGVVIGMILPIAIPSVMQTDQLRYIWDGFNTARGINPYSVVPIHSPEFYHRWWVGLINHAHFATIYPPFAEILFALSAFLNPFLWGSQEVANLWQLEFGLSLFMGGVTAWTIFLLRRSNWILLLFNPLFLVSVAGNLHVDGFLIPFVLLFVKGSLVKGNIPRNALVLAISIGVKWVPIIFLPFYYSKLLFAGFKKKHILAHLIFAGILLIVGYLYFAPEIATSLLSSTATYVVGWSFFSVSYAPVYLLLTEWFGDFQSAIWAKVVCGLLGVLWSFYLLYSQNLSPKLPSLRLTITWLLLGFYIFFPVLNPWYFVLLLAVGLPYFPVLLSPLIWPTTAFISQVYYLSPVSVGWLSAVYYLFIGTIILRDLYVCRDRFISRELPKKRRKAITFAPYHRRQGEDYYPRGRWSARAN